MKTSTWAGTPEMCWSVLNTDQSLIAIKAGEPGYHAVTLANATPGENAMNLADRLNKAEGVTNSQRAARENGSMFGWAIPAANPENPINADAKTVWGEYHSN